MTNNPRAKEPASDYSHYGEGFGYTTHTTTGYGEHTHRTPPPGPEAVDTSEAFLIAAAVSGFPESVSGCLFTNPVHRVIADALRTLKAGGVPIDLATVLTRLEPTEAAALRDIYANRANTSAMDGDGAAIAYHQTQLKTAAHHRRLSAKQRELNAAIVTGDLSRIVALAGELGALAGNADSDTAKVQPFEFHHCRDVVPVLETFDFVEGILTDGGVSVVYAPSGAGKSFWALDLCAHVANGETYRDELAVEQGAVLYLTLEGGKLFPNRIAALKKDGRIDDDTALFSSTVPFNLLSLPDPARLIETIRQIEKQYEVRFRMVVIDTLARAITGADESSNEVMGRVLASAEAVCAATGSHVMLVHHTGKIEAKGARGGSALKCGLDTEIELRAGEGRMVIATVTKAKDLGEPPPMVFSLRKIELGVNTRGRPVTSCVVDHHPEIVAEKPTGEASRFRKMKPAPTPSQVLDLLPPSGSIPRKLFEAEGMAKLNATVIDFKAVLERLIVDERVRVIPVKARSGQWQNCLVRV